jgi:hypothetical protein
MNTKILFLTLIAFLAFSTTALADSPLTSTSFGAEYADLPVITQATSANGLLTPELAAYLYDKKNPIDVKMAVINQLSWDMDGKANAPIFLKYVLKKGKYGKEETFLQKGTTHELLCMAYLLALDNYFDMAPPLVYADVIGERAENSYTVRLIVALIRAQAAMDNSWCDVYTYTNEVRNDASLTLDMRPAASRLIFEYMDLYASDCYTEEDGGEDYEGEYDEYSEEYSSPVTSTPFASVYEDEPLISEAIMSVEALTEEMMAFLADENRPLEYKMALINGLAYRADGSSNGEAYLAYILQKGAFADAEDFKNRGKIRDLLCVAYLKAMDNVYDMADALEYVNAVRSKNPDGYTANIICALIEAQQFLNGDDWCLVYQQTDYVRQDEALRQDMKSDASDRIFSYMDLYQEYCEQMMEVTDPDGE